jgi:uncharacterized protein YqiB (DUF1249 family)
MKPIGYIIYQFWDMQTEWNGKKDIITVSPMPEFKKRIYSDARSAEEAVEQLKKHWGQAHSYHILPIFTPQEEYNKVTEAYRQRLEDNDNKRQL